MHKIGQPTLKIIKGSIQPDESENLPVVCGIDSDLNLGWVLLLPFGTPRLDELWEGYARSQSAGVGSDDHGRSFWFG